MSDYKEVRQWETISIDTKIPGIRFDVDGVPRITVVSASDHDRIVAELRAEVVGLLALIEGQETTIARQARVIEKLREQRDAWIWGTASSNKDRCRELVALDDQELEAIERGES